MPILDSYDASGFFVARTPLLPFDMIVELGEGLEAAAFSRTPGLDEGEGSTLETLIERDRDQLRERLSRIIRQPEIVDALFVASPSLVNDLARWNEKPDSKKGRRLENSVMKYFMRAASRCTPFGLFSGVSVGTIGEETRLELTARSEYRRSTRLDMGYLTALANEIVRGDAVRRQVRLRTNSSAYGVGDRVRYAEAHLSGRDHDYFLVEAGADEFLTATLERARTGAFLEDLAEALVDEEIELEDARGYLDELIEAQLLVPDLGPVITGPEAIGDLSAQFSNLDATRAAAEILQRVRRELADIDHAGLGATPSRYRAVAASLETLDVDTDIARLFQVDLHKPSTCMTLSREVRDLIAQGVETLVSLFGDQASDPLQEFREGFRERYEDREVSLVEVLDEEVGIGYQKSNAPTSEASPLLRGLEFPQPPSEARVNWRSWDAFLLERLLETLKGDHDELVLTEEEVAPFRTASVKPLPDAFQVSCQVVPRAALREGDGGSSGGDASGAGGGIQHRLVFNSFHGPSGARLLGRFCQADPELCEHVEAHIRAEEALDADAVYCELVHHPQGRVGNILARPVLRDYELVYLGRSGAPIERQIDISDLVLSLRGDMIILRSKRLGKEVIPRLTTAHNTEFGSLGIYSFLAALQHQQVLPGGGWSWGVLAHLPYLPRVRYGEIFYALRTWNARSIEIERITKDDPDAGFLATQRWRLERNLPRFAGLADGDNVLTIDFENPLSVAAFLALIKNRPTITLRETLDRDALVARGAEGRFQHELLVPFVRKTTTEATPRPEPPGRSRSAADPSVRIFPPGSPWLYVKIYTGPATMDRVLVDVVRPLAQRLVESEAVSKWFFIRYGDPDPHLRVRVFGDRDTLMTAVLPAMHRELAGHIEAGLVWKVQIDTYDREIARYGGPAAMELCEEIFFADSDACGRILERYLGDESAEVRWRLTLKGMDMLLEDLGFDIETKSKVAVRASEAFAREFGIVGAFRRQVRDRYRSERQSLSRLIYENADDALPLADGISALADRSSSVRTAAARLRELDKQGELVRPLEDIAESILHMHVNRLLRWSHRAQEAILYTFLEREYSSQVALQKKQKTREDL